MKKETQNKEVREKEALTEKTLKEETSQEEASKEKTSKEETSPAEASKGETSQEKTLEERYEEYRRILEGFTLMNDAFMRNVLDEKACTEYVLQVILQDAGLKVLEQVLQKDFKNLQGRSATMDCVVRSTDGRLFDVEIQQETEGASPKRARYYSGLLDANTLNPGENFDELPESFVIFITRDDVLGGSLPIYHIKKQIIETGKDFGDESYIIYVNADRQDDTDLGRLMHDFHCKSAGEMYSKVLAERVRELKETTKGVQKMCREMERIYQEGLMIGESRGREIGIAMGEERGREIGIALGEERGEQRGEQRGEERGIAIGELKKAQEVSLSMSKRGTSIPEIAETVNVSIQLVEEWLSGSMGAA